MASKITSFLRALFTVFLLFPILTQVGFVVGFVFWVTMELLSPCIMYPFGVFLWIYFNTSAWVVVVSMFDICWDPMDEFSWDSNLDVSFILSVPHPYLVILLV